jgi:hypothetical protein
MNRNQLVLALLAAAEGRPYTPVQIQKAVFLVVENLPALVTEGAGFDFRPYDYGPFDADVYLEAQKLAAQGKAVIAPSAAGRWATYAATDDGIEAARRVIGLLEPGEREYLAKVSNWVRSLHFSSLVKSIYDAYPNMRVNSIFRG